MNIEEERESDDFERIMDNLLMWNESNHECLLFSNEQHVVRFLSMNPLKMKSKMHPRLLQHLKENNINVGEDLNTINTKFHDILGSLSGIYSSHEKVSSIMEGNYCLTGDSLLKMLAIFLRSRCGLPVVLMGECGCGKTMLIKFLCAWMNVKLFVLDVHGGTSEEDIYNIFTKAENEIRNNNVREVYVFLDEINTCSHMGLLCEVICQRSLYGRKILENIKVLAALNPYRKRPNLDQIPGLVFRLHDSNTSDMIQASYTDPMAHLVYRVHPIPKTLLDFIFDFGSLSQDMEKLYIHSMISKKFIDEDTLIHKFMTEILLVCQNYVRTVEKESSATSLRDIERCLTLTSWFVSKIVPIPSIPSKLSPLACCFVLGIAFVYYYRLGSSAIRQGLWKTIHNTDDVWIIEGIKTTGFKPLFKKGSFEKIVSELQNSFCKNFELEDGIAMNQALMENLFVTIICILNKIPIFIVGKPGSSKTLTMQVIANNLQGKQSQNKFWHKFPAVYIFQYQCSPMSSSNSIQHQFDMAVRYQQHAENVITVLLLDEVGLAEHSPDMPLKVLHGMLVNPSIAIVGLSNWTLDPAKMNRAICLQRTDPSPSDIQFTGSKIVSTVSKDDPMFSQLESLAISYHNVYTTQKGSEFIGMRDYYSLIKYLRLDLHEVNFNPSTLTLAICRNFGGKEEVMKKTLEIFHKNCFNSLPPEVLPASKDLLIANLSDKNSRHLMVLTKNGAALSLMFGANILDKRNTVVLVGSEFKGDQTELHLVQQINQVKLAMAAGKTLVLVNHDNIYEALYDVLNQRYLFKKDATGVTRRMLRLAIGSRSQLCNVADTFKIVVIIEEDHAYNNLDLPLLNRFEKQLFSARDVLSQEQWKIVEQIKDWVNIVFCETKLEGYHSIFCGFHSSTIASSVLYETNFSDTTDNAVERIKQHLARIALPVAVLQSPTLASVKGVDYFSNQSDLKTTMKNYVTNLEPVECIIFLTYSKVTHLDTSFDNNTNVLLLSQLSNEKDLIQHLDTFLTSEIKQSSLIIQCDPISCKQSLINHAQYLCIQQKNLSEASGLLYNKHRNIIFMIHLPPGISNKISNFSLDFNLPWKYYFIDDLRDESKLPLDKIINNSVFHLVTQGYIDIHEIIVDKFQYALSFCPTPDLNQMTDFRNRITLFRKLLEIPEFEKYITEIVISILESQQKNPSNNAFYHVLLGATLAFGGSLRNNLLVAIETIIIQCLTYVIRFLDRDFNIHLLKDYENISRLWYEILNNPIIFNREALCSLSKIGSLEIVSEIIYNYGKYISLVAKFPHSYAIIKMLESNEIKKKLNIGNQEEKFDRCDSTLPLIFGDKLISLIDEFGNNYQINYLHDFVAISVSPLNNLSFDVMLFIYETILRTTREDVFSSIGKIHVAIWINEERLYVYSSILSLAPFAINNAIALFKSELQTLDYSITIQERLKQLDSAFLLCILDSFWTSLLNYNIILDQFVNLLKDLESLILMLTPFEHISEFLWKNVTLKQLRTSLMGLMTARIIIQEICIPGASNFCIELIIPVLKKCSPGNLTYLVEILSVLDNCNVNPLLVRKFFNRNCQEIIFGVREGFLNSCMSHFIELELIDTFSNIINGTIPLPFNPSFVDLTSRKLALYCSLRSKNELVSPIKINTPEGFLLYLQNFDDSYAEIDLDDLRLDAKSKSIMKFDMQEALNNNVLENYLSSIAKCKQIIMKFIKLVSLNPQSFVSMMPQCINYLIKNNHNHVIIHILKALQFYGGIDLLASIIYLPKEDIPWLCIDRNQLIKDDQLADVFIWYGSEYNNMINMLRKSASSNNKSHEFENFILNDKWNASNLLAATFTELYLNKDTHTEKGIQFTSQILDSGLNKRNYYSVFAWLISSKTNPWSAVPKLKVDEYENKLKFQVIIHILALALHFPNSWLNSLLLTPFEHIKHFLPSIPDDEFLEIVNASGRVGWYRCVKGHPYSVGNCTLPMEVSKCLHPGCGEQIGGTDHVSVKGVTRMADADLKGPPKLGYILPNAESTGRISLVPNRMLRFILHSLLLTSLLHLEDKQPIIQLILPGSSVPGILEMLWTRMSSDWDIIKQSLYLGNTDVNIVFHLVLKQMTNMTLEYPYLNDVTRAKFENDFSSCVVDICDKTQELKASIKQVKDELNDSGRSISVKNAFTLAGIWDTMNETNSDASIEQLLWRIRLPVSYKYFTENFHSSVNNLTLYPTLADFLKEESRLPYIKYIADVLLWHNILFEVIANNSITREEAASITNSQILDMITPSKKSLAGKALVNYCIAFNAVLPQIENIFECQDNPYITGDGRVDLSGTKTGSSEMSNNTPIIYSLPSMQGEVDVPGMCTIQIINFLQNSHNQILKKLMERIGQVANEGNSSELIPSINYLTPYELICKRLIHYDRNEQFLPLIKSYAIQSLDYGEGYSLTFDFESIEAALINGIIAGKIPLVTQIHHFNYRGDIQKSGRLQNLCNKIHQINISSGTQQTILSEIDTLDKFTKLMSQLEVSINFLASFGSKISIDPKTLWEDFVKNVLMINQNIWKEITTPTITQQVQLCHLQSLYLCLEEKMKGNPLDDVISEYRQALDETNEIELKQVLNHLELDSLLVVIREFLISELTEKKWSPSSNLKEYLVYAGQRLGVNLEVDWYDDHFPESLELRHCYQVYQLLYALSLSDTIMDAILAQVELSEEQLSLQEMILNNCKTIIDLSNMFFDTNWEITQVNFASECIREWTKKYKWPQCNEVYLKDNPEEVLNAVHKNHEAVAQEIQALIRLYVTFKGVLITQETVSRLLRNNTFNASLDNVYIVRLIDIILKNYEYSENRMHTGEIRKAIAVWISRLAPSIKVNTAFKTIAINLLQWWTSQLQDKSYLNKEDSKSSKASSINQKIYLKFKKTLHWIIKIHLESQFVNTFSEKTLASLQAICNEKIHSTVFAIFRNLIPMLVQKSKISEIIEIIFSKEDSNKKMELLINPEEYYKLTLSYRSCISDVLLYSLIRLEAQSESINESRSELSVPSYFNRVKGRDVLDLIVLLRQDALTWSCVIPWYHVEKTAVNHEVIKGNKSSKWELLNKFVTLVSDLVMDMHDLIENQMITVEYVNQITFSPLILGNTFNCLAVQNSYLKVKKNQSFIDKTKKEIAILNGVVQLMFNNEEWLVHLIKYVESNWKFLTINDLNTLFQLPSMQASNLSPLPLDIIKSYHWFNELRSSKMFMYIWNSSVTPQYQKILEISKSWKQLHKELISDEITFGTVEQFQTYLSVPSELGLLLKTANGFSENTCGECSIWNIQNVDDNLLKSIHQKVLDLMHLSKVYKLQTNIQSILSSMQVFSSIKAISETNWKKNQLRIMNELLSPQEWDSIQMFDLAKYTKYSSQFHPCLLKLDPVLIELVSNSLDIFRWLREMRNDADFTSGVEMAMSKSEMECPPELWKEEAGKLGRPDEEKLSMISSVRSYLYGIIYRTAEKFDSYEEIITVLSNLRESDSRQLISSLNTCNEFSFPLKELLNSGSDDTPEQLTQLFIANRCTTWICSNNSKEICFLKSYRKIPDSEFGVQLWLQWMVARKEQAPVIKILNLSELMDFQSSIVLSKTDDRSALTQSQIEKFITQFNWMKELYNNIDILYKNGNFDYQDFTVKIPIDSDPNMIRNEALRTKQNLETWITDVERIKEIHYYLNFFSIKQIWNLVKCLKDDCNDENSVNIFKYLIQMIQPRQCFDMNIVVKFIEIVKHEWSVTYQDNMSKCDILNLLGTTLQVAIEQLPIIQRLINNADISDDNTLTTGVHLIASNTTAGVTDQILSVYYTHGYLPESEYIYMCKKSTIWEELDNIINRWKKSHLYNRTNRLYCIGSTHVLNFELQHKLVSKLKAFEAYCKNPLLLVSCGIENQYLVSQYSHKQVNFKSLSQEVLGNIGNIISENYSQGIHVYSSMSAGTGKTFQIRSKANKFKFRYIHFPIYNTQNITERIINKTNEFSRNNEKILLHIDLAESVPEDINSFLFDLVYLGNVIDPINGYYYCWNPELTCICIEVACGKLLQRLRICELLQHKIVRVSNKTLCVSHDELIAGMGEEFDSPRYDGTRLQKEADGEPPANAYQRLQYVCSGLILMQKNGGKFPYVFENINELKLESEQCFQLLMEAAKLDVTKPSLWCMWNFINMFYFQLRDMHYPNSPINSACIPDPERLTDVNLKERIKGEVVQFLIRTAREFATRQIRKEDPEKIVGLYIIGLSRAEWNGFWERTEFDNDNQPCFHYKNNFYVYYRSAEKRWVIDDVLEPEGASFSSSTSADINSEWKTCCTWERDNTIRVKKVNNAKGYQNQGLLITGPPNKQGSIGETEYGEYVRLPQYDDITDRPHYVKIIGEKRRHVFWSDRENVWQICPVCNNDEGAYGLSATADIEGTWRFMPPDKKEINANFKFVTLMEKRNNTYRNQNPKIFQK